MLDPRPRTGSPRPNAEQLGQPASRTSASQQAREYHRQALVIARDIGAPQEEAHALEGIGHSHLQDSDPTDARTHLQQALAIYQRIEAPDARRVQKTLSRYGLALTPTRPAPPLGSPQ